MVTCKGCHDPRVFGHQAGCPLAYPYFESSYERAERQHQERMAAERAGRNARENGWESGAANLREALERVIQRIDGG